MESYTPPTPVAESREYVQLQSKLDAIYVSVEKTRKYFLYTLIATLVTVLLPVLALLGMLPAVIDSVTSATELQVLSGL